VAEAIRGDLANAAVMYRMVALMFPALEPGPVIEELRERFGEELLYGDPPSTELGRIDAAYRARWRSERGFVAPELSVTSGGVIEAASPPKLLRGEGSHETAIATGRSSC
jgi:hypothetical protein